MAVVHSISFPNMFGVASGKVQIVEDDTSLRQSMKSVLLSRIGELLGDPQFGSDILSCIFELQNEFLIASFKQKAVEALRTYVKHVIVETSDINMQLDEDNRSVQIWINYRTTTNANPNILQLTVLANGAIFN